MQRRGSFYFNLIPWPASLSCSLAFLATPISVALDHVSSLACLRELHEFVFPLILDSVFPALFLATPITSLSRGEDFHRGNASFILLPFFSINFSPFHPFDSVNGKHSPLSFDRQINRDTILDFSR